IRERFAPFTDFPIIFGSAITKQRILRVLEEAIAVHNKRKTIISTSQVNNVLQEAIAAVPPPATKGKYIKIKYITMLKDARVPSFVFFCNLPQWIKDPYKRYLENKIREKWDFCGTPINLYFRQK
ncbi:MAG: ribosome biogenesis GTPase Der, partial [Muribaculaceae bacterium]|nr:ribosome biogenesis GTPase Der [Muribaculaceae bacterium]